MPNQTYGDFSVLVPAGCPFFQRRYSEKRQGRLRLCLLADAVLFLYDRSQDGRAVCLWNARRTADEGSGAGQRLGESESRRSCEVTLVKRLSTSRADEAFRESRLTS